MIRKIREVSLHYPEIVVGSSLEAITYSFLNNLPFFFAHLEHPHRFDRFDPNQDLSLFDLENTTTSLHTPKEKKIVGIEKGVLWERLYFYLSLAGLNPISDCASSLRFDEENLFVFTHQGSKITVSFDKAYVFSDIEVYGLPEPLGIKDQKYKVYDWFDVRRGMNHEFDAIQDDDHFVTEILFFQSERADNSSYKDAVAISYLTEQQLSEYEYSDVSARFKTLHLMKESGIKGPRNGRDHYNKEKFKYYAIRIENAARDIVPMVKMNYKSTDRIDYKDLDFNAIIDATPMKDSYVTRLYRR